MSTADILIQIALALPILALFVIPSKGSRH
jgi:hypothetical protein